MTGKWGEPIEVESLKINVMWADWNIYDLWQYWMWGKYVYIWKEWLLKLILETLDKQLTQ
jgi:hypothetical protein